MSSTVAVIQCYGSWTYPLTTHYLFGSSWWLSLGHNGYLLTRKSPNIYRTEPSAYPFYRCYWLDEQRHCGTCTGLTQCINSNARLHSCDSRMVAKQFLGYMIELFSERDHGSKTFFRRLPGTTLAKKKPICPWYILSASWKLWTWGKRSISSLKIGLKWWIHTDRLSQRSLNNCFLLLEHIEPKLHL